LPGWRSVDKGRWSGALLGVELTNLDQPRRGTGVIDL
jgi:hypothetical protein